MRRRRRNSEKKMPATTRSLMVCAASGVCIGIFIVSFGAAIAFAGNTYKAVAAIGTLTMLVSIWLLWIGTKEFKDTTHKLLPRFFALALPLFSLIIWMVVYVFGYVSQ